MDLKKKVRTLRSKIEVIRDQGRSNGKILPPVTGKSPGNSNKISQARKRRRLSSVSEFTERTGNSSPERETVYQNYKNRPSYLSLPLILHLSLSLPRTGTPSSSLLVFI